MTSVAGVQLCKCCLIFEPKQIEPSCRQDFTPLLCVCVGVGVCERRAVWKTVTDIQKGEKMSVSNKAAGVKGWRLLCLCSRLFTARK